jgi:hypothetical protein
MAHSAERIAYQIDGIEHPSTGSGQVGHGEKRDQRSEESEIRGQRAEFRI